MQNAGLISPEQAAAIAEHFGPSGNRLQRLLLFSVSSLAGMLILAGIIMLISANWEEIPDAVKMGSGIALMAGFWAAYGLLREKMPMLAETMGLMGSGMWLANIALYGQIFQLQNPFVEGCALFFCGIALQPFLAKQRLLIAVVVITSFVLLAAMQSCKSSPLHLPITTEALGCCLLLLGVCWWMFAEYCNSTSTAFRAYAWLRFPLMGILVGTAQGIILYGEGFRGEPVDTAAVVTILLLMLLFKPVSVSRLPWTLLALFTAAMLPVADFCDNYGRWAATLWGDTDQEGICLTLPRILYCFLYALLWIWCGCSGRQASWINCGCILVCFVGIGVMSNMLESLNESGFVLIAGGLIMLPGAIVLEKQRRRLIRRLKSETETHP